MRPARWPSARPRVTRPYLDGLFTYCLSVLCDHDEATAALGDILAVSERQYARCPPGEAERQAWLYALARWACLRKLAERRRNRQGAHTGRTAEESARRGGLRGGAGAPPPRTRPARLARGRRHHARAARGARTRGPPPARRPRGRLGARHELPGRARTARRGRLRGRADPRRARRRRDRRLPRASPNSPATTRCCCSAALRRELVRHVDDCPRCRRAAERAGADGPWPGSTVTPAALPLAEAPRAAAHAAMLHVPRARGGGPALRPRRVPDGPQGPGRPARPAAGAGGDHHRRRDRRRRPRLRALGRLPRRPVDRRTGGRREGHRRARPTTPPGSPAHPPTATRTRATPAARPTPASPRAAAPPTSPSRSSAPPPPPQARPARGRGEFGGRHHRPHPHLDRRRAGRLVAARPRRLARASARARAGSRPGGPSPSTSASITPQRAAPRLVGAGRGGAPGRRGPHQRRRHARRDTVLARPGGPGDPGSTGHPGPPGSSAPARRHRHRDPGSPTPTPTATPPSQSPTPTKAPPRPPATPRPRRQPTPSS